ncbi:evolutionarily conserved signaling intermediate in Toll pathway, mitochondrial [Brevipalpus obovatus]|uniref:evolutionarily conserved signaling intermediate in Toll pathway, mitochondrial n=1 Tax=Brevipalpus obovatus TaxID=246614 RepID=UPI003D9E5F0A
MSFSKRLASKLFNFHVYRQATISTGRCAEYCSKSGPPSKKLNDDNLGNVDDPDKELTESSTFSEENKTHLTVLMNKVKGVSRKPDYDRDAKLDSLERGLISGNEDFDFYKTRAVSEYFEQQEERNYRTFRQVINDYNDNTIPRDKIGSVDFIYGALRKLRDYGLHKEIRAYKDLMDVFPKGIMVPKTPAQQGLGWYVKHQWAAVEILDAMEVNFLIPDEEMLQLVISIFGESSPVVAKLGRMIYWMTKARYNDPYPMPTHIPEDPKELAKISLRRMTVDVNTKISIFSTECIKDCEDKTWVMSATAPKQIELLNELDETLFVEGPHWNWVRDHPISYFVLRTAPRKIEPEPEEDNEDMRNMPLFTYGGISKKQHLEKMRKMHINEQGVILSLIATGTSTRDSLLSWIRIMQHHWPKLNELPIVIQMKNMADETLEFIPDKPTSRFSIGLNKTNFLENRVHTTVNASQTLIFKPDPIDEDQEELDGYIDDKKSDDEETPREIGTK